MDFHRSELTIGQTPVFGALYGDTAAPAGICAGTSIMTRDGAIPVEHLNIGDRIITRSGTAILRAIEVSLGEVALYKVSPNALGTGRPEDEILLPAGQKIYIRDWRAKALFGKDQIAARVSRIADGSYISKQPAARIRLFNLIFERPEIIYAGGLELATDDEIRVPLY